MRELKFRIWWPRNKTFSKPFDLKELLLESNGYNLDSDCIFEQFTGLKDKNGKEIFEGDILLVFDSYGMTQRYPVLWDEDRWTIGRTGGEFGGLWEWVAGSEVVGNLHKNPELLAKKEP